MPRDEPVGSLGLLALKPTEFREQVGMIGFRLLHDVPPRLDNSGSDQLPCKAGAEQRAGEDPTGHCLESQDQPLLPMARLNV